MPEKPDFSYEIDAFRRAVAQFSQAVNAKIELEGMVAANAERTQQGLALAYSEKDFEELRVRSRLEFGFAMREMQG